jgi:hypothetical protein
VVPKHRRSEIESSRASLWAPANTAEEWPEAVGYGQFGRSAGPMGVPEPGWAASPQEPSWQELEEWQNWGPPPVMHPDHPSAPVPRVQLSDDYPSGPMPAPRGSGAPDLPHRRPGGSARTWSPPPQAPDAGFDNGSRRLYAVPDAAAAEDYGPTGRRGPETPRRQFPVRQAVGLAGPDWPEPVNFQPRQGPALPEAGRFQPQPGRSSHDALGYQRQTFPGWQESPDYWPESAPFEPDRGPATGPFRDGHSASRDSRSTAGQVLTLADGRAAQITQEAQDYADAICDAAEREAAAITEHATGQAVTIREAAEREAATIREAAEREAAAVTKQATGQAVTIRETAEREAAELRARLDSMTGELGRVAAYVTETLIAPANPATLPALPSAMPALPGARPASPDSTPAKPGTRPAKPAGLRTAPTSQPHEPGTKTANPGTAPRTRPSGPARQTAMPAKQGETQGRQRRAFRVATAGTAALLSVAAVGAITMTGLHGFSFFVFREAGQGETPGNFKDTNFLARQAAAQKAAAHHHDAAPKGRHHKTTKS